MFKYVLTQQCKFVLATSTLFHKELHETPHFNLWDARLFHGIIQT